MCVCVCVRSLEDIVIARQLRWLGHLARMDDHRLAKKILFGWLPQRCPAHGTRMRWREVVSVGTGREWLEEKLQDRTRGCD